MLGTVRIANFKSYSQAFLELSPLTLLVGANAAGKTNCIEALRFLSRLAHGQRIDDILDDVRQNDLAIRGRVTDMVYDRRAKSQYPWVGFSILLAPPVFWRRWDTTIEIRPTPEGSEVASEKMTQDWKKNAAWLYNTENTGESHRHEIRVEYNDFKDSAAHPTLACSNRQAVFTQLDIPSRFEGEEAQRVIPEAVTAVQLALRSIIFLDLNPRAMVGYSFIIDKNLRPDGSNLSSVLYDICETQGRKQEVLDFIGELPEQPIADITFLLGPRQEVMVQLVETFGQRRTEREAPLLSDGTLRVLAIAAALLSAPTGGLVVVEEIDNGVHPNRAKQLLHNILTASKANSLRVLLTSHNPALLDALPRESVPNVVCCYRDPTQGDSRLVRLAELTDYPELVASGPLGQLMTQGLLDRYLKNQRTPEQKTEQAQEWLRQLQLNDEDDQ